MFLPSLFIYTSTYVTHKTNQQHKLNNALLWKTRPKKMNDMACFIAAMPRETMLNAQY